MLLRIESETFGLEAETNKLGDLFQSLRRNTHCSHTHMILHKLVARDFHLDTGA